ncbi:MAG: hypothetical protein DRG20_06440 [Deltaproteobacteria bacterium]|nr:hypothetical protein [Deltaproteobacteria bacterium]RLA88214.1 MAG: hypothetical protein DRG20_06440 [Deltaproteobacteria bacterium]
MKKGIKILIIFLLLGSSLFILFGCGGGDSSWDESTIYVYNYDVDHFYRVELHTYTGGILIGSIMLDEYNPLDDDWYNNFNDVVRDDYYLVIYEDNGNIETDRTPPFWMDGDSNRSFYISDDGKIHEM